MKFSHRPYLFSLFILAGFLLGFGVSHANAVYNGDLDVTFNNGGYVRFGFGDGGDNGQAAVKQPDGKILVVAESSQAGRIGISVMRYDPDGLLDEAFGRDGKALYLFGPASSTAGGIALQPDGKILVCGTTGSSYYGSDFLLFRLNIDGSLDATFGIDGSVTTNFSSRNDGAGTVLVQPDRKIVLVGNITPYSVSGTPPIRIGLARYNPDGSLDTSFNGDGRVSVDEVIAGGAVLLPDGKILAGGGCFVNGSYRTCVVRFTASLTVDSTFNGTGMAIRPEAGSAHSVALQSDGKVVLMDSVSEGQLYRFVRFNTDGTADNGFGTGGITHQSFDPYSSIRDSSLLIQADGKIFATGWIQIAANWSVISAVKLNTDGSPDTGFDGDGKVLVSVVSGLQRAGDAVAGPDGTVVIIGGTQAQVGDVLVTKLRDDGSVDTQFGKNGVQTTDIGDTICFPAAMALQQDGKIIVGGNVNGSRPRVARLNSDGSFDLAFNGTGKALLEEWSSASLVAVAVQPDGKILVAGRLDTGFMVGRIDRDGTIDRSFGDEGNIYVPAASVGAMALQPDGKIIIGGSSGIFGYAMFRFNEYGALDRTFGRGGRYSMASAGKVTALAVQPDGKIVSAGQIVENGNMIFLNTRLDPNGRLDAGFGVNGVVRTDVTPWADYATSIALNAGGKIAIAGYYDSPTADEFIVVRYNPDGSLDTSFNGTGMNWTSGLTERANSVAFRNDGKLIVAGFSSVAQFGSDIATVRYGVDGVQDTWQWGQGGLARANIAGGDEGVAMALDSYGRPIVVGPCEQLFCVTRFTSEFAPVFEGSVSGSIVTNSPERHARISMTDPFGSIRTTLTDAYGRYRFDNVPTGAVYTFSIKMKTRTFTVRQITVSGDMQDVNFSPN